jgi:DNA-directed RNA polymerase alpha subunit
MNDGTAESSEWQTFLSYPFSGRTRNFFIIANIESIAQLAAMSRQELLKIRGVGRKTVLE